MKIEMSIVAGAAIKDTGIKPTFYSIEGKDSEEVLQSILLNAASMLAKHECDAEGKQDFHPRVSELLEKYK
jgi:hypothetical protein